MTSKTHSLPGVTLGQLAAILIAWVPSNAMATVSLGGLTLGGGDDIFARPFQVILGFVQSASTPILVILAILAGLALAAGEAGAFSRKAVGLAVGGTVVVSALTLSSRLFEGAAGALMQ